MLYTLGRLTFSHLSTLLVCLSEDISANDSRVLRDELETVEAFMMGNFRNHVLCGVLGAPTEGDQLCFGSDVDFDKTILGTSGACAGNLCNERNRVLLFPYALLAAVRRAPDLSTAAQQKSRSSKMVTFRAVLNASEDLRHT